MRKFLTGLALLVPTYGSAQTLPVRGQSGYDTGALVNCLGLDGASTARCLMPGTIIYDPSTGLPLGTATNPIYTTGSSGGSAPTGPAGTPNTNVLTVQGINGGTPQNVRWLDALTAPASYSAASGTVIDVPVNGRGTVSFTLTGLAAAGATLTASVSDNGGVNYYTVRSMGTAAAPGASTIAADGLALFSAGGHTNVRLTVTTAGTGNFTAAYNVSSVARTVNLEGAGTASTNPLFFSDINCTGIAAYTGSANYSLCAYQKAVADAALSTAASAVNQTQINGVAVATGTGATGTGVQRNQLTNDYASTATVQQGATAWIDNLTQIGGTAISTGTGAAGTGVQRSVLSNDYLSTVSDNLNQVGGAAITLGTKPAASSVPVTVASDGVFGNSTIFKSGSYVSSYVVKASAGTITSLVVTTTTVGGTIQLYDATTAPADGAVQPSFCAELTGQTPTSLYTPWPVGTQLNFTTGIVVVFSSGSSCTTKTTTTGTAYMTGGFR